MANYFDYLAWRGDLTFEQDPFNEIDSAILAEVSYFPFEHFEKRMHLSGCLGEVLPAFLKAPDLEELVLAKAHIRLMKALAESERFRNLSILEFKDIFDEGHVVQFAVVALQLAPDLYYISFRGTNHTLVGWQEDFNMGVEFPVLSQKLSVIYLNGLAEKTQGNFILGGHSKGGNLAIYAGAFCDQKLQERIVKIFNFDGPGFESWIMTQPAYLRIAEKIRTIVPQSSIIGMLLEQAEGYQVVRSSKSGGMAQHITASWEVERNHFIKLESVTDKSLFLDAAITGWITGMDYQQRKQFVDVLFGILKDADVQSLGEISPKHIRQMLSFVKSYASLEPETRKQMSKAIMALIRCAREEAPSYGAKGIRLLWKKDTQELNEVDEDLEEAWA